MSKAADTARAARNIPDKTVPAYMPPSSPANITHEPIARGEQVALSPTHPLGTVKEKPDASGGQSTAPTPLVEGRTITVGTDTTLLLHVPQGKTARVTVQGGQP